MTHLITGGAGFIGSHLVERLLKEGAEVVCLDNFDSSYESSLKRENIKPALEDPNFSLLEADLRESFRLESLFSKFHFDTVVHLAARTGVRSSLNDPVGYGEVNVNGTAQLLEYCRKYGISNFVFASSSPVYGEGPKPPFSEETESGVLLSPYAATKLSGEFLCQTYHRLCGINVTCLRIFNVYGPRQRPDMAVRSFTQRMLRGEEVTVFGDGSAKRDYLYVDDAVEGIVSALQRRSAFEIINLGGGHPVETSEVIAALERETGLEAKTTHLPPQPGDMEASWADLTKAERLLGYRPRVSFEEGISRFVRWIRGARDPGEPGLVAEENKMSI